MNSESSEQSNRGAAALTAEGVVLLLPKRYVEWWVWVAGGMIVLRGAFLVLPYATHGGEAGMGFWSLGIDSTVWNWPMLFVAVAALVIAVRRRPFWTRPRVVGAVLLGIGALAGRLAPLCVYPSSHDDSPSQVRFRLPLDGPVTVAHGGPHTLVNYHAAYPDQRWAYDLLVTRDGKSHRGDGKSIDDYYCYGQSVLAPVDGTVRAVMNEDEDLPIGQDTGFKNAGGNQVMIEVAPNEFLFICHMQPGSITVKAGDLVATGQVLGRVGNSGHTSEPHVHIHLQDTPEDGWGEGIPLYFHNYRVDGKLIDRGIPTGGNLLADDSIGQIVEHEPSQRPADRAIDSERPLAAEMVEFRETLDRAFGALRKQGIVTEPKFEDCVRCAVAAMSDLLEERNAPGGVYWHDQDDERLERGEDLNIGFVGREDRDAVAIAQKLVAALKAEGLTVEWDGSADTRVTVKIPWNKP